VQEIKFKMGKGKVTFLLVVEHSEAGETQVRETTELCMGEEESKAIFSRYLHSAQETKKIRGLARKGKDEFRLPTRTFILSRAGEGGEEIQREVVTGTIDNGL
jgi:hypothetical protein